MSDAKIQITVTGDELARAAVDKVRESMGSVGTTLKQVADATNTAGVSFGKLVSSYVTSQAIIGAVKGGYDAFVGEIKSSITAAGEAEKAHVQVTAALRAQGTAVPSVVTAYLGYADALQQTTIFQDDAIEGAEALLVQVGNVMPRDMQKALEATTNLASGLGKDLTSATMLVAKAAEGNTAALTKAGVVIDETKAKQEGFGYVLDQINEKFAGQAAAIAGTYEGRLAQLGNTWNNVEESVGRVITQNATVLNAFDLLNKSIAGNTKELNSNRTANELVSDVVIGAAKSLSFLLDALDLTQTAYQGLRVTSNTIVAAFANIGLAVLDTATAIGTYTKYVNPVAWTSMWKNGMHEIADQSTYLKGAVAGLTADSLGAIDTSAKWGNQIQGLKSGIDSFANNLEATRGKTVELTTATNDGTGAWDRQTRAVDDGKAALERAKKAAEDHRQALEKLGDIQKLFTAEGDKHWKAWFASIDANLKKANDATVASFKVRFDAQRDYDEAVAKDTLSARDVQARQILQTADDAKRALDKLSGNYRATYDLIEATARIKLSEIGVIWDEETQDWVHTFDANWSKGGWESGGMLAGAAIGIGMKTNLTAALNDIPQLLSQAFTGGGGILGAAKALGAQLAAAFLKPTADGLSVLNKMGLATGATVGAGAIAAGASWKTALGQVGLAAAGVTATAAVATGATVASVATAGALTLGIGAAAVGVALLVKHWLSVKQTEKDARTEFEAYQKQFGTLDDMIATVGAAYALTGRTGAQAQAALTVALDATHHSAQQVHAALVTINDVMIEAEAKSKALVVVDDRMKGLLGTIDTVGIGLPDMFRPMIDDLLKMPGLTDSVKASLQGLASGGQTDFGKLEAVAKGYGIQLGALGHSFQQAHVTDEAKKIIVDFENLKAAGADMNGVIGGMSDEISSVVQESMKFGTTIPENMRGMIEALITSGGLLDENGKKIDDISTLKFGDPVKTDVEKIQDAIKALADAIDRIPGALAKIPANLPNPFIGWGGTLPEIVAAPSFATEAYDLSRPMLARIGDAGGDSESVLRASTVKDIVRASRSRQTGAGGGDLVAAVYALARSLTGGTVVAVDGRVIARAAIPHIPAELRRLGAI